MRKKCEELYQRLEADLEEQETWNESPIETLRNGLYLAHEALNKMKLLVLEIGFASELEEIEFFKHLKPKVYGLMVYVSERYSFENSKPILVGQMEEFFNEQIKFISRFFRQHEFMYQYYRLRATEMDSFYFLRGKKPDGAVSLDLPELDTSFATYGDYLFAKFIGYEKLQGIIVEKLKKLSVDSRLHESPTIVDGNNVLKWTGDKTNLVEVIYGLFYSGQFENGNATLSDIIKFMEVNFQIDLSQTSRKFIDIRNRKKDSPTKFLEKMRESIMKRIDEDNEFKPHGESKTRENN